MPATPSPVSNDQPVLVIGALIVDAAHLYDLTHDFLSLKHQFFPGLPYPSTNHLDVIIPEIKGADLRRNMLRGSKKANRHAIGFLDKLLALLEKHNIKLLARIYVKPLGQPFSGRSVYTSSIQWLYAAFNRFLNDQCSSGFCIADSRDYSKNVNVAHSIFTQKFRAQAGDNKHNVFEHILELPTFAHSENHAGIQICDMICSALLFPIACYVYCTGYVRNVHVQSGAADLKARFGLQLQALQYRYYSPSPQDKWRGGVTVTDSLGKHNALYMFR